MTEHRPVMAHTAEDGTIRLEWADGASEAQVSRELLEDLVADANEARRARTARPGNGWGGGRSVLDDAAHLVEGDRNDDYGHPADDFARTAYIWSAILGCSVSPEQVALCMIGLKLSRLVNAAKRDSVVDIAGYARTFEMVMDRKGQVRGIE